MAPVGSVIFRFWEGEGEVGTDIRRVRQDRPLGSRLLDSLSLCQEILDLVAMAWSMAPVGGASFYSWEGEGEGGSDI